VDPASTVASNLRFPGQYWDEETGLHYNWNRYYNSTSGRYVESDPIRHHGGDVNYYRYAAGSPSKRFDFNGLLTIIVHGTYSPSAKWAQPGSDFNTSVSNTFGDKAVSFNWTGGNNDSAREDAALALAVFIQGRLGDNEALNIVAHSHGGNVVKLYSQLAEARFINTLITLGTPQRCDYVINRSKVGKYLNIFSSSDLVQVSGGGQIYSAQHEMGPVGRTDPLAVNIDANAIANSDLLGDARRISYNGGQNATHSDLHSSTIWNRIEKYIRW
jgi:RHS repeat-associated protein